MSINPRNRKMGGYKLQHVLRLYKGNKKKSKDQPVKSNGKKLPNFEYVHRLEPGLLPCCLFLLMPSPLTVILLLKKSIHNLEIRKTHNWVTW